MSQALRLGDRRGSPGALFQDLGGEQDTGGADPHVGSGDQLPHLGGGPAAEGAGYGVPVLATAAPPPVRVRVEVAGELSLDLSGGVPVQLVQDASGARPGVEG